MGEVGGNFIYFKLQCLFFLMKVYEFNFLTYFDGEGCPTGYGLKTQQDIIMKITIIKQYHIHLIEFSFFRSQVNARNKCNNVYKYLIMCATNCPSTIFALNSFWNVLCYNFFKIFRLYGFFFFCVCSFRGKGLNSGYHFCFQPRSYNFQN